MNLLSAVLNPALSEFDSENTVRNRAKGLAVTRPGMKRCEQSTSAIHCPTM